MESSVKNSILVVDDETANHIFLTKLLRPEYILYVAKDGKSGLQQAREILPDLILLDIIMPDISGYEVLATLKNENKTRDIPVIFITGLNSSEDEIKGLASNAADYINKPFNPEIVKLRVRNQIKIVNQIHTINRLSSTDQLTGIANRRGFDEQMEREWGRTIRENLPLSILIIDVDRFKTYNDTYGHQQGDVALQAIAKSLAGSVCRSSDFVARWGGEEFAVLLPNTALSGAVNVAEHIRENVEQTPIPLMSGDITRATISIGASTIIPTKDSSICDFIAQADKALYTAKNMGRNKVCHH